MNKGLRLFLFGAFLGSGPLAWGQSVLTLGSATAAPGVPVSLNLSLASSGTAPAALQFTLSYPASGIAALAATTGPASVSAGKSISCASVSGAYTCVLYGINSTTIPNGVVAVVGVTLASATPSASIQVTNAEGASLTGDAIAISATGGAVAASVSPVSPALSSLACSPASLNSGASSTCVVTLNGAAAAATTVTLAAGSPGLTAPASVSIPAGSATSSFGVSATPVSQSKTVTLTASIGAVSGSSSANTSLTIVPVMSVSSLNCAAASLSSNASTVCTIALSLPAPATGATLSIASSSPLLTAPSSVTAAAGATSVPFTIATGSIPSAQTATVSVSLANAGSASATISLSPGLFNGLLTLTGGASELSGASNGSVVTPTVGPAGLKGLVVVNGQGSVNPVAGSGVYFLNCCAATNNAYYKFTGAQLGSLFGIAKGEISFTLQSRYSFAARQTTAASPRFAFDVSDGNAQHQFAFWTMYYAGKLEFAWLVGGSEHIYMVPSGTEDELFGSGVRLNVRLTWDGQNANLYLNGIAAQSASYVPAATNWSAASIFNFGAYQPQAGAADSSSDDIVANFRLTTLPLLELDGTAKELSGVTSGSAVNPAIPAPGTTGAVVVNGGGSVNVTQGSGVYFLNCCSNVNNAYYKFGGAGIGNVFGAGAGQISFTLQSRYSFAQRQSTAAAPRYAFDVRDGNAVHQFYFMTQVVSGRLVFYYLVDGTPYYFYVPAGTEDQLFGSGVNLNVTMTWDGVTGSLYLNNALAGSVRLSGTGTASWNASSNFDLGAYESQTFGGYNVSDDAISDFVVTTIGG